MTDDLRPTSRQEKARRRVFLESDNARVGEGRKNRTTATEIAPAATICSAETGVHSSRRSSVTLDPDAPFPMLCIAACRPPRCPRPGGLRDRGGGMRLRRACRQLPVNKGQQRLAANRSEASDWGPARSRVGSERSSRADAGPTKGQRPAVDVLASRVYVMMVIRRQSRNSTPSL